MKLFYFYWAVKTANEKASFEIHGELIGGQLPGNLNMTD